MERFTQTPPEPDHPLESDRLFINVLHRWLDDDRRQTLWPDLEAIGERCTGELYHQQIEERDREPELIRWDAWGNRVDRIRETPLWKRARELAVNRGLVRDVHEEGADALSRIEQLAKVHLFHPSTAMYSCPLAMTDGAAVTLNETGPEDLRDQCVSHVAAEDVDSFWESGQWMTETAGGSDVGRANTEAVRSDGTWRLSGRKWFASAVNADMSLALARPAGNPGGGEGLALFFLRLDSSAGPPEGIRMLRLKEKLGTRALPTAEVELDGAPARLIGKPREGVRRMAPMLNVTRTWNSITAVSTLGRGLALLKDFARKRTVFDKDLADQPLFRTVLNRLETDYCATMTLTARTAHLLGRAYTEQDEEARNLIPLLASVTKLYTAKICVRDISEILESFGGAGYVEDTGIPMLLRDAQVLPVWEGPTNVLALETLRSLGRCDGLGWLESELDDIDGPGVLREQGRGLGSWLEQTRGDTERRQAESRRWAVGLGRLLAGVELVRQVHHNRSHGRDGPCVRTVDRFLDRLSFDPDDPVGINPL